nr:LON peptidase substrate-binding domain-containing protein [Wenzhouxiangella sp. XN201]
MRVFEQRYLDMVRECARSGSGFGVICAWPAESENRARHARIGTEAMMVDFDQLEDGLLGVTCRGQRRFLIRETRARDDGLLIGDIDWLPPEPAVPVPTRLAALQTLMQELLRHREVAERIEVDVEDASSLGRSLAGTIDIPLQHAQALLEMTDPVTRLEGLLSLLEQEQEPD